MLQSRRNFIKTISLAAIATSGVAVFLKKCTKAFGPYNFHEYLEGLVDCAFRLTNHTSLLNLEFYFINCSYDSFQNKVWAKYGPHENYMIVRLPQQHIAEQNFPDNTTDFRAVTYISGYSYLVFRILFTDECFIKNHKIYGDGEYTYVNLKKEELLNWGNEDKFRLVVRQDLTESLFELCKTEYYNTPPKNIHEIDSLKKQNQPIADNTKLGELLKNHLENRYPFQQKDSKDTLKIKIDTGIYNLNSIPKVYGDPITAIELPWRLIISPKLPDSSRFKFKWEIPDTDLKDSKNRHKLWTATLSITERDDEEYINKKNAEKLKNEENAKEASTGSLNDIINQLELMILGSPDYPYPNSNQYKDILPRNAHRSDLVALYIKLKVLARTEKLTLSAIGATAKIHLKNEKIEDAFKQGILVIEWNQIISLGRDEKVEVSTLFLEADFGHKMAYIEIAERKLRNGVYVLIKSTYIMPLDITKDYTNHITQNFQEEDKDGGPKNDEKPLPNTIVSRFNSPFKKITFLETKPKKFISKTPYDPDSVFLTETSFEFEAIDWHDNKIMFSKNINGLPFGAAVEKEGEFEEDSELRKIISNKELYIPNSNPDNLPKLKDSIPFNSRKNLIDSISKINNSDSLINSLNESVKNRIDHSRKFDNLINLSFSNKENAELESLHGLFDDFVQFYRKRLDDDFNQGKKVSEITAEIEKLNKEYIVATIRDEYLFKSQNFKRVLQEWLTYTSNLFETIDGFVIWFSDYRNKKEFTEFFTAKFPNELKKIEDLIKEKLDPTNEIIEIFNKKELKESIQEWKQHYFNSNDNVISDKAKTILFDDLTDISTYSLYSFIQVNSPELRNLIRNLKAIWDIGDSFLQDLRSIISQQFVLIYEIEAKAKQIPGLILLQKQKIGYAIQEKIDEATNQTKKSLSELESEYIIFIGGLRETENKLFDFFHDYAIIPQVIQAKIYVSALNKLVNEDLPISINYAREYLENQVNDAEFEIKQNASMVFAEVQQYSREQVKGLIQKMGDKMPGLNVEIPAHYLTYARNPEVLKDDIYKNLKKSFGDTFGVDYEKTIQDSRDLIFISEDVKNAVKVVDDLRNVDPKKYFKGLGAKLFGSIGLEDILDIGFDVPRITELPDKLIYQVSTDKFKNFQASFVVFKPNVKSGTSTRLELFVSKSLKNIHEYYAYTQLNNFSVGVVIGGTEVLTVLFDQFKITSSPNQPKKTDVSITEVTLGGPLEFIADLAKKFMAPGNGMRVKPGPRNLSVDYAISLPDIVAPAFNFRNLQMVIGVNIPYDPSTLKAISFTIGVNKPEDKFLVSAGIYGGRGHFMLRATPTGIEYIDIAIELGAYASLDLGIGKGEVFLFFGFWFVCGKDNDGQNLIKAVAYVICSGSATVLGFITIGVSVLIALTYIKRGQEALFYGEAVVTYSVKIAFFKKEFSIRYSKEIAGSSKGNGTTSLQEEASMFPDLIASEGIDKTNNTKAHGFTDIFKKEKDLTEYLSCFA